MITPQKVVKRLFPAGFTAGSCSSLQPSAITIWLSSLRKKADEIQEVLNFIRKSLCDFLGDNHIMCVKNR